MYIYILLISDCYLMLNYRFPSKVYFSFLLTKEINIQSGCVLNPYGPAILRGCSKPRDK